MAIEIGVEAQVGVAQQLEGLGRRALGELERVADRAGLAQMAVPAAVVEVVVRVDDVVDVLGPVAGERQRAHQRLVLRLDRLLEGQHGVDVVAVEAGVEEIEPVGVVDQHAVDGEAHFACRPAVPVDVEAVDHQRAAVQDKDPRLLHRLALRLRVFGDFTWMLLDIGGHEWTGATSSPRGGGLRGFRGLQRRLAAQAVTLERSAG